MTRQEQIQKAAENFAGVNYDIEEEADSFYHHVQKEAFIAGAIYADEHPNLYSVTRKAVEREREYLINKACEWLRRTQPQVIFPDTTIERFKKAMEEQE